MDDDVDRMHRGIPRHLEALCNRNEPPSPSHTLFQPATNYRSSPSLTQRDRENRPPNNIDFAHELSLAADA